MNASSSVDSTLLTLTVRIVTAYVSHNHIQTTDVPELLFGTYRALTETRTVVTPVEGPPKATLREIDQSVTADYLVSFEDGKPYKTLRRHLSLFGLTPEAYRAKWGLPPDYPMTAPAYSAKRAALARALGLGLRHRPTYTPSAASSPRRPRSRRDGTS
jgi:predicted transcriptional regulator